MTLDERIDAALKRRTEAEASDDFVPKVRERLRPRHVGVAWRRPAAIAGTLMLAVAVVLISIWPTTSIAPSQDAPEARMPAPAEGVAPTAAAPLAAPSAAPAASEVASRSARPMAARRAVAVEGPPADHERALPALASLDGIDTPSISMPAIVFDDRAPAPLPAIPPLWYDDASDLGGDR